MEAAHTLQKTDAKPISDCLYTSLYGHILITGMGPEQAQKTLDQHIADFDHILNFGIVGALKKELLPHTFYTISQVSCLTTDSTLNLQEEGLHLLTSSTPLHDPNERDRLAKRFDLIDMEGYQFAACAKKYGKKCQLIKIISDFCTEDTSEIIRSKLPNLSELIYKNIFSYL